TCPVELKNIFGTFVNDYINNNMMNTIESEHIIEAFSEVHNEHTVEAFVEVYINNNIMELEHAFENHVVNDILEPGRTFATFVEACATIERYTAQMKAALFAYE
ncbi:15642_t:CDS:2, partial [Gigaspora rosea]